MVAAVVLMLVASFPSAEAPRCGVPAPHSLLAVLPDFQGCLSLGLGESSQVKVDGHRFQGSSAAGTWGTLSWPSS